MYQIKYVVVDSCFGAEHKVEMVSGVPVWMFLVLKTPSAVLVGGRLTEYEKNICVLYPPMTPIAVSYTSPRPRDRSTGRMPSSA